jgi:hypothetical protein
MHFRSLNSLPDWLKSSEMKRLTLFLLIVMLAAVTALPQKTARKSVFGVNTGISIPVDEFAAKTFTYDAGFATMGPNLEVEYLYYGKIFGFSSSIGYTSIFFNEKAYQKEYDRTLNGYGTNEVSAGNYQVLKFLVGFTLKTPEFKHTEVLLLVHLGYALSVHPNLEVTNSEFGVINSITRVSGDAPVANLGVKINYWLNDRYGVSLNGNLNLTEPSFYDETGPGGSFLLPIHYTNINVGFVMNLKTPRL